MNDYAVTMQDSTGRTAQLFINGDSINELVSIGMSLESAKEESESNAFSNAISRNEIGADAWIAADRAKFDI